MDSTVISNIVANLLRPAQVEKSIIIYIEAFGLDSDRYCRARSFHKININTQYSQHSEEDVRVRMQYID